MNEPQNFFEFFGIAPSPLLDEVRLREKYYANMHEWHPDLHTLKSEKEQEEMLALSTLNNRAFQTLIDPDKRLAHLLELHGRELEGQGGKLPPDFLMEMMEWNETLAELEAEPDAQRLSAFRQMISNKEDELAREILPLMQTYSFETADEQMLDHLQNYFFKRKYFLRIKEKLTTFAPLK